MNRRNLGFTIVEVTVIIVVIAILTSISVVSFNGIQKDSRDSQRESDMLVIKTELEKFYEKNGVYPPGCAQTTCSTWFLSGNTTAPLITANTTIATLKTTLPGLSTTFADPKSVSKNTPILATAGGDSGTSAEYYYYGGTVNYTASGSAWPVSSTGRFPCTITSSLSAGQVGSYVVGYYNEAAAQWVLYGGKYGKQLTITGPAASGCVINT